jgi:hypothetical protein
VLGVPRADGADLVVGSWLTMAALGSIAGLGLELI